MLDKKWSKKHKMLPKIWEALQKRHNLTPEASKEQNENNQAIQPHGIKIIPIPYVSPGRHSSARRTNTKKNDNPHTEQAHIRERHPPTVRGRRACVDDEFMIPLLCSCAPRRAVWGRSDEVARIEAVEGYELPVLIFKLNKMLTDCYRSTLECHRVFTEWWEISEPSATDEMRLGLVCVYFPFFPRCFVQNQNAIMLNESRRVTWGTMVRRYFSSSHPITQATFIYFHRKTSAAFGCIRILNA